MQLSGVTVTLSVLAFWSAASLARSQESACLAPWATGYDWIRVCRGEPLKSGAVMTGRSITDGDVYSGRSFEGEPGKITMQGGKMHSIYTHSLGQGTCGEILVLHPGVTQEWQPYSTGDALPEGAVLGGETTTDGKVYVARNKYSKLYGSVGGKANLDGGSLNNLWIHGHVTPWKEGDILVAKKGHADCQVAEKGYEWAKICKGDLLRGGSVMAGHSDSDGDVYVGRTTSGEPGKMNLDKGKMWSVWGHTQGQTSCGDMLLLHPGWSQEWVSYKKGDPVPDGAVMGGETTSDGKVYVGRNIYSNLYGSLPGKVNVNGDKMFNLWIHGYMSSWKEGEVLVVKPDANAMAKRWNPNALCDGSPAGERAEWLQKNQGLDMEAAKAQVMKEFPNQF